MPYKYGKQVCFTLLSLFLFLLPALAGPPYDTDDPETVAFKHWEFYCSTIGSATNGTWIGDVPYLEANYGAAPFLQLHINEPLNLYSVQHGETSYESGATELGAKIRFVGNDSSNFQMSLYPAAELPITPAAKSQNTQTQLFLPLWIEKKWDEKWSSCLGGGYWINPGTGNKNYEFVGLQTQYQFAKAVSLGAEIEYLTASEVSGSNVAGGSNSNDFRFRIGSIVDLSDYHHLLFSFGRSIVGPTNFLWYVGYQLTI